jgi:hypothetical protein
VFKQEPMAVTVSQRYCAGGLRFRVILPDGALAAALTSSWKSFAVDAESSIDIDAQCSQEETARPPRCVFPTSQRLADGTLRIWGPEFAAQATPDRRRVVCSGSPQRLDIENVVKLLMADWLLDQGGLLLHSVAVSWSNRACLFTGPSGAGKSTLGALCAVAGWQLLGDELVAVRPTGGTYLCDGTPWNVGAPRSAMLKLVGDMAFAQHARLQTIDPGPLLRLMLANAVMPDPSASGRAKLFRNASRLLERVPSVRLYFAQHASPTRSLKARLERPAAI